MESIRKGDYRKATASWRKAYKKNWKSLANHQVEAESIQRHNTDPLKWTCACNAFLVSRFLICKHIVYCYKPIEDPFKFFHSIKRQRTSPFWVDKQLVLLPEYARDPEAVVTHTLDVDDRESIDSESEIEEEELLDDYLPSIQEDPKPEINTEAFEIMMKSVMDIFYEQKALGNTKFIEKFIAANANNQTLSEEIDRLRNRRTMSPTWAPNKHPATMYYR